MIFRNITDRHHYYDYYEMKMEFQFRNNFYMPKLYKLPAVKESLYHPKLPTFRRMDIDTAAHKLPDEHCRTTSMFEESIISIYYIIYNIYTYLLIILL